MAHKMKKFEPVYYRKATAEDRQKCETYGKVQIKKVHASKGKFFEFRSKGKNIKRKTGYKLVGGKL